MSEEKRDKELIKEDILALARRYLGQGDADFSKQEKINILVNELLDSAPQPPVKKRLSLLYGPWKQVWGPYDYRNKNRGIDPSVTVDEIYQVVFEGGYYYNVNPNKENGKIGLLRGEYKLASDDSDFLNVHFTAFPATKTRPNDLPLWELPKLAEAGTLPDETHVVPKWIVRLFFGGGALREVYTDDTMRITYGAKSIENRDNEFIYIMTRP